MRIRSQLLTVAAGWTAALFVRMLARTLRFEILADEPGLDPSSDPREPYIYALWHDQILPPLARHSLTRPAVAALVSKHQDGTYLTEFMKHSGVRSVRGSTARGGDQALRELLSVPATHTIFITPDGPRGPHHELKPGLVYLASRSGRPIVPAVAVVDRAWYWQGNWTGLLIPKPFSTVRFRLGRPHRISADATREELEQHTAALQQSMLQLEADLQGTAETTRSNPPHTLPTHGEGSQRRAA